MAFVARADALWLAKSPRQSPAVVSHEHARRTSVRAAAALARRSWCRRSARQAARESCGVVVRAQHGFGGAETAQRYDKEAQELKEQLLELVQPAQNARGRLTPTQVRDQVLELVQLLEACAQKHQTKRVTSAQLPGTWKLLYTTRPGTASPIQRFVVGQSEFVSNVFQDLSIDLESGTGRFNNVADFKQRAGGKLYVQALIERIDSELNRLHIRFDLAYFEFTSGLVMSLLRREEPLRVPYPVPFKLLGKKACGWLDVTFVDADLRISRGNKGSMFILVRERDAERASETN
ncbi:putative plastid-lipid-associated protein 12, chloroplastic [Porphyridium purpureum]|uniref:Putative plastid-lipid-associated protein 12, chloroplastic n=1 Tax=Porphyridium purpureum TaxID=35688 RepID=A0A5J4YNS9_PORPP|nr:putative plastid-lipid-associated protein 12, chloroplastic [Porphyridium purpureum]|eukprot:POR5642..scf249_10